ANKTGHRYPPLTPGQCRQPMRVTVDKPGSGTCQPQESFARKIRNTRPYGGQSWHASKDSVKGRRAALPGHDKSFNLANTADACCRAAPPPVSAAARSLWGWRGLFRPSFPREPIPCELLIGCYGCNI